MAGILYIVATPIGNLEDITLRAMRILGEADLIAAEDTRHTLKLLNHLKISKPLTSYFEHNKNQKGNFIIKELLSGKNVALVSDAGTPAISDPGEDLVRQAIQEGIQITSVPGPCAAINAAILSGFPLDKFVFEGFLSTNKKSRKERLKKIKYETRTIIFYEAPHKILNTLKDMYEFLGDREICLAREMTKKFEETIRGTISEVIDKVIKDNPKGEFVLIMKGAPEEENDKTNNWEDMSVMEHIEYYLSKGMDKKEAIKTVALDRKMNKREIYNIDVQNKK